MQSGLQASTATEKKNHNNKKENWKLSSSIWKSKNSKETDKINYTSEIQKQQKSTGNWKDTGVLKKWQRKRQQEKKIENLTTKKWKNYH
jgi:hypothetical protein